MTGTSSLWLDLESVGVTVGTISDDAGRGLGAPASGNRDTDALPLVGKVGLGDLDISSDEKTLYTISLASKELIQIDIATKNVTKYAIPNPGCTDGEMRPMALKYYKQKVYVGVICDASSSQSMADLKATVFEFDGNTFNQILSFPLDYTKGMADVTTGIRGWFPWTDNFNDLWVSHNNEVRTVHPQPLMADIEFAANGDMVMGFMDRTAMMAGFLNLTPFTVSDPNVTDPDREFVTLSGGDILRAENTGTSFVLESGGTVGGLLGAANGSLSKNPIFTHHPAL